MTDAELYNFVLRYDVEFYDVEFIVESREE